MTKEVIKRDGSVVPFNKEEIQNKITKLCIQFSFEVNVDLIVEKVLVWLPEQIETMEIDSLTASACNAVYLNTGNDQYSLLAGAIFINNINKSTLPFCEMVQKYQHKFDEKFVRFVITHKVVLQQLITYDITMPYHSVLIFCKNYLFKDFNTKFYGVKDTENGATIIERIASVYLRAAIVLSNYNIQETVKMFHLLEQRKLSLPTPTLFNSGRHKQQLTSCFIITTGDSLTEWQQTLTDLTTLYQYAGGVALDVTCVRQ